MRKRGAFSLIELLVVLAVIAILAGLLLPALTKAKQRTRTIACMNHLKQFQIASQVYTGDNADALPPNARDGISYSWVWGAMTFEEVNPLFQSDTTNSVNMLDPKLSALGPYVKSHLIYRCPADSSYIVLGGSKHPRVRSYSMNGFIGRGTISQERGYLKVSDMTAPAPSDLFVFSEEHDDFVFAGRYLGASLLSQVEWGTMPTSRHNRSAVFSFADGHVGEHRWQDKQTFQPVTRSSPSSPTVYGSKDIPWLSSHATTWR